MLAVERFRYPIAEFAIGEVAVEIFPGADGLLRRGVFVAADVIHVDVVGFAEPGAKGDAGLELLLAGALDFEVAEEFDADVAVQTVSCVGVGFVNYRAALVDGAVGSDEEMVGEIGPVLFGLAPGLHVAEVIDRGDFSGPQFASVVDGDPLGDLFAGVGDGLRLRSPFRGGDDRGLRGASGLAAEQAKNQQDRQAG